MSVTLGGGEVGVTQQLLDRSQVGASVEQVRGEGVTEGVGMGGRGGATVEDAAHVTGCEAVAPVVDEERVGDRGG